MEQKIENLTLLVSFLLMSTEQKYNLSEAEWLLINKAKKELNIK